MKKYILGFSGKRDALIGLWIKSEGGCFTCDAANRMESAFGCPASGDDMNPGLYRVWINGDGGDFRRVEFSCPDNAVPFLMPGPGITPSHFHKPEPALRLWSGERYRLTVPMENGQRDAYVAYQSMNGRAPAISLRDDSGEIDPQWYPQCAMPYHCARVPVRGDALRVDIAPASATRFTVWEGNPVLLDESGTGLPMGGVKLSASGEDGQPLDARFEIYTGGELVMERDVLVPEECVAELPEGVYDVLCHHGGRFSRESRRITVRRGETASVAATLRELVRLPAGWAWGDEHVHSVFEDGSPLPDMILRAARATGSNYAFLTDHDVEGLISFGVSCADAPGKFVGMAGQEIICHELHMNILNSPWRIPAEPRPAREVHPDICDRIQDWLREIDRQKERHSVTFMLNHPYHSDATRTNPALGYFRSWWVRDRFPQFHIVENFDFQSWFDRLNRGERIVGVWTTDSHDCSRLFAGKKGTCVYVGDELSPESIVRALDDGHAFSARWPGAAIFLTVNGVSMGDELTARPGEKRVAHISVQSAVPMELLDIVANGYVVAEIPARGATQFEADVELPGDALWAVARLRQANAEWPRDDHSFEPLMTSGFSAFTNPVYIREARE